MSDARDGADMSAPASSLMIRRAEPHDYAAIGSMLVSAYAALPGMPSPLSLIHI